MWAGISARALLIVLFLVVFVASIFIAGASLHDPDTCWLLALGQKIVETGSLPGVDPYSYTMQLFPDQRFILYQWLTEVLFALSYRASGLMGLLLLAAIVLTGAFVSLPLALARKMKTPGAFALIATILTLLSAFFHFLCRPEIFSYLMLGIYIALTHFFLRKSEKTGVNWIAVTIYGVTMAVWCNLHSGFVLGLLYLFVFVLFTCISELFVSKKLSAINKTGILCFVAGFLATFVNPYGAGLWQYLPTLFFTPLNKYIVELKPLSGKDFLEWTYYPFFILAASTLFIAARALQKKVDPALAGTPRGQIVFAAFAIFCWMIAGIVCRRLIPFAAIHMFAEGSYMLALLRASDASSADSSFVKKMDDKLDGFYQPRGFMWFATIAVIACVGVYFVASRIPNAIVLPQSGAAMQAPFDAVKFIEEKKSASAMAGNLFNDPQFGDVLIWKASQPPKLFIDTRFDMYGAKIVDDYQTIYATKPGWKDALRRYQIKWIFVRPEAKIAKALQVEEGWKVLYQDKASIIVHAPQELEHAVVPLPAP